MNHYEKEIAQLNQSQTDLIGFDDKLLDLDDDVKFNYSRFGDLLAELESHHR